MCLNYETAVSVEKVIREQEAVPATIRILAGHRTSEIVMTENELRELAADSNTGKCARRDIGISQEEHVMWNYCLIRNTPDHVLF